MTVPFLDLQAQYRSLKADIDTSIQGVLDTSSYILGPQVVAFENAFAAYCGVAHCIGVSSGTSALALLLQAYDIGPGDEVILPANTFIATAEAVSHIGATPVLIDCHEDDALIDTSKIEQAITPHTKALLPVHLYGQIADMDAILDIAKRHSLLVFEDACQAHGALYKGKRAGSMGNGAAFSFYPGKNLGAYGDAGAVTTNDERVAQSIRALRDHGSQKKYHHDRIGWNERMDGIQGAVLGVKLAHLDRWNDLRRLHAAAYRTAIGSMVRYIDEKTYGSPVYHLFVIRTSQRTELQQHLSSVGIQSGIHYPIPIHLQPAYSFLGYKEGDFPATEQLSKDILSLPMFAELHEDQINSVCDAVRSFFRK